MNTKSVLVLILLVGLLTACNLVTPTPATNTGELSATSQTNLPFNTSVPSSPLPDAVSNPAVPSFTSLNQVVLNRAFEVAAILKVQDMAALSTYVHPASGLRFSPYSFVNTSDLVFTAQQVAAFPTDSKVYTWGSFAGSGEPISLGFPGYYADFIYDQDFINAPKMSLNHRVSAGSALDNSAEFYPGSMIVEFHFPGIDPQYEGMDWRSLRLVFTEQGGTWYLVGLIHDEWTP